jgi:murein DD-endopeptidase MepM/ murein hydrolase activator NlpD
MIGAPDVDNMIKFVVDLIGPKKLGLPVPQAPPPVPMPSKSNRMFDPTTFLPYGLNAQSAPLADKPVMPVMPQASEVAVDAGVSTPQPVKLTPVQELEQELANLRADQARRRGEYDTGMQELAALQSQDPVALPDAPEFKPVVPLRTQDSGGALLGAGIAALLGMKPQDLQTGVSGFLGMKSAVNTREGEALNFNLDRKYKNDMKVAETEMRRREGMERGMVTRLNAQGRGIDGLTDDILKTQGLILGNEQKSDARKARAWDTFAPKAMNPNASKADRAGVFATMEKLGLFDDMTPEEKETYFNEVNQDGSQYALKVKQYNLKVDDSKVKNSYTQWRMMDGDRKFVQRKEEFAKRVEMFNTGWAQRWAQLDARLGQAWSIFEAGQAGANSRAQYGVLTKEYSSATKAVENGESELISLKSELAGMEKYLKEEEAADASKTPTQRKISQMERAKAKGEATKLKGQIEALEIAVGEAKTKLAGMVPPAVETVGSGVAGGGSYSGNELGLSSPLGASLTMTSGFGTRTHPVTGEKGKMHKGIDLAGKMGDPVKSFKPGIVTTAGWDNGYGNWVEVLHPDGTSSRYGHLSSISVKKGQQVGGGELLGAVGSTGLSTGPHLHFEIRDAKGNPVDPAPILGFKPSSNGGRSTAPTGKAGQSKGIKIETRNGKYYIGNREVIKTPAGAWVDAQSGQVLGQEQPAPKKTPATAPAPKKNPAPAKKSNGINMSSTDFYKK